MTFGEIIREERRKKGLSQKELAARIKKEDGKSISPSYLNEIEHDRRNPVSDFMIQQLTEELELHEAYLYYRADKLPPELRGKDINQKRFEELYAAFRTGIIGIKQSKRRVRSIHP